MGNPQRQQGNLCNPQHHTPLLTLRVSKRNGIERTNDVAARLLQQNRHRHHAAVANDFDGNAITRSMTFDF